MHVPAFAYPQCVPNNKEPDMRDVKERLARLERVNYHLRRQNRWTQLGVLVLGALVFLAAGYPQTGGEVSSSALCFATTRGGSVLAWASTGAVCCSASSMQPARSAFA